MFSAQTKPLQQKTKMDTKKNVKTFKDAKGKKEKLNLENVIHALVFTALKRPS